MAEKKQAFLQALIVVLKEHTRTSAINLEYVEEYTDIMGRVHNGEYVKISYEGGGVRYINVACDSQLAIIEDIIKYLY